MNRVRKILAVIMLCIITVSLTGCTPDIVGSWKLSGGNALQAIYSISGDSQLASGEAEAVFVFSEDGKFTLDMTRDGIERESAGTWVTDGDKVTITIDGQAVTCAYSVNDDVLNLFFTLNGENAGFILDRR